MTLPIDRDALAEALCKHDYLADWWERADAIIEQLTDPGMVDPAEEHGAPYSRPEVRCDPHPATPLRGLRWRA